MVENVLKLENMNFRKRTTQPYKDNPNSFFNDLMDSIEQTFVEIRQALIDVEKLVIFDENYGKNLDLLGSNIKEFRNGEDDKKYLARIKLAYSLGGSIGDENTIIEVLSAYLDIDPSEVVLTQLDYRKILIELPDTVDQELSAIIIKKVKAAGIRVEVQYSKYWEDFTYEEIEQKDYPTLAKYRYERGGERKK